VVVLHCIFAIFLVQTISVQISKNIYSRLSSRSSNRLIIISLKKNVYNSVSNRRRYSRTPNVSLFWTWCWILC